MGRNRAVDFDVGWCSGKEYYLDSNVFFFTLHHHLLIVGPLPRFSTLLRLFVSLFALLSARDLQEYLELLPRLIVPGQDSFPPHHPSSPFVEIAIVTAVDSAALRPAI